MHSQWKLLRSTAVLEQVTVDFSFWGCNLYYRMKLKHFFKQKKEKKTFLTKANEYQKSTQLYKRFILTAEETPQRGGYIINAWNNGSSLESLKPEGQVERSVPARLPKQTAECRWCLLPGPGEGKPPLLLLRCSALRPWAPPPTSYHLKEPDRAAGKPERTARSQPLQVLPGTTHWPQRLLSISAGMSLSISWERSLYSFSF